MHVEAVRPRPYDPCAPVAEGELPKGVSSSTAFADDGYIPAFLARQEEQKRQSGFVPRSRGPCGRLQPSEYRQLTPNRLMRSKLT